MSSGFSQGCPVPEGLMKKIIFLFTLVQSIWGQSNTTAALSGTVVDPTDAVVPGAAVTIANPETGFQRETKSDQAGFYRFDLLPPGDYDLRAEVPGFQRFALSRIPLLVGAAARQDIRLTIRAHQ